MANKTVDGMLADFADKWAHDQTASARELLAEASRQLFEAEAALQEPLYRQVAGKPYATDGFKGSSNIYYERVDAIPIDKLRAFYGITETEEEAE